MLLNASVFMLLVKLPLIFSSFPGRIRSHGAKSGNQAVKLYQTLAWCLKLISFNRWVHLFCWRQDSGFLWRMSKTTRYLNGNELKHLSKQTITTSDLPSWDKELMTFPMWWRSSTYQFELIELFLKTFNIQACYKILLCFDCQNPKTFLVVVLICFSLDENEMFVSWSNFTFPLTFIQKYKSYF